MGNTVADATCGTCGTIHLNAPVERDEQGGYAVILAVKCNSCPVLLCNSCDQQKCSGCDQVHCPDHLITVPGDYPETPMRLCPACWLEVAETYLTEPECECSVNGGDLFDPSGCELHNSSSWWNVRQREITAVQELEQLRRPSSRPPSQAVVLLGSVSDLMLDEGVAS